MIAFILEIARRIRWLFRQNRLDTELREEMETHLAMLAAENDTVSARRQMGNLTRWQEISRDARGWSWLESLVRDISYGTRLLVKSPGFTLTACLSLAIGIGATMGIFSLMNALLFKTLPVPEPKQLWKLGHGGLEQREDNFSYPMFVALNRFNNTGVPFFAVGGDYTQVNYGDSVRNTPVLVVSGNAFQILHLKPYAGRLLTPEDDVRGIPHGANCVLSYRLWKSRFHGDLSVIGSHITIGLVRFTIVGIAPPQFFGFYVGAYSDLILPITAYAATNPAQPILDARGWTWLILVARVPPGMTAQRLTAGLNTINPAIRRESVLSSEEAAKPDRLYLEGMATGVSAIRDRFGKPLYILLVMTGLILIIACANIANLLLVRSIARQREIAVRLSLGAKRSRVLRQLLTESALIAVLGALVSVPVYVACTRGLVAFLASGSDPNVFLDTTPDWRFITGALVVLCGTVLIFGLVPALRGLRCDLNIALSESSQRLAAKTVFAKVVVAAQISLSLILLLGAALLSRSLYGLRTFNPGFRRDHLLIADVDTTQTIHKNPDVVHFFNQLLQKVRALPGVRSAAASVVVPLSGRTWQSDYQIAGDRRGSNELAHCFENWVTPAYFQTLGTPLILGRSLSDSDSANAQRVAVVNEAFARRWFNDSNPIGYRIVEKGKKDLITIIGVVGDARYRRLQDETPPTLYRPIAQLPSAFEFLLELKLEVWTSTPAASLAEPVRQMVHRLDAQAFVDTQTFDSLIDSNLLYERLLTALSIAFGIVGLTLSTVGVYGLSAYSVARRTSELGIRMAMGATPRRILKLVLSEHFRLVVIGVTAGLLASIALTRFLRAWLFGISATDPILFCFALLILSAIALCAALVPARRAAHLNPLSALRHE